MRNYLFFILLLLIIRLLPAQQSSESQSNPLSNSSLITFEGMTNFYNGDFPNSKPGYYGRFGYEYYFASTTNSGFGIRTFLGYGQQKAQTTSPIIVGGVLNSPTSKFETKFLDAKIGLTYILSFGDFLPYVSIGGNSILWFKALNENGLSIYDKKRDITLSYFGEIGFKFLVNENLSFNLAGTFNASGTDEIDGVVRSKNDVYWTGILGFSLIFGGKKDSDGDGISDEIDRCPNTPAGIKVDEFGCPFVITPTDEDADGVPNDIDKCPKTPRGVRVDKNGCPLDTDSDGIPDYLDKCPDSPANVKVDSNGCTLDSDLDGIDDSKDKCPNTPKDVKVDEQGCPIDSDSDGVPDYLDKCPNTKVGQKVDVNGCPILEIARDVIVLQASTSFRVGKSVLTEEAKRELQKIAKIMLKEPSSKWRIEGHTDNQGSSKLNQKLSEERAYNVLKYLVSLGVNKNKLTAVGMGEQYPIAKNDTEEGRQKNRRVVITRID